MDLLNVFQISNIVIAGISVLLALLVFYLACRYKDQPLATCSYIFPFALLLLAAFKVSTCFLVTERGVEIFPTQSLTLLSACFCVFAMATCAFLNRRHYRLLANWILLLSASVSLFFINQLMMHYHYYRPLYSFEEISTFRTDTPIFFFGRFLCLTMVLLSVVSALFMVGDAHFYDYWRLSYRPSSVATRVSRMAKRINVVWTVFLMFGYVPLFVGSIEMHILFNLFYFLSLIYSFYVCKTSTYEMEVQLASQNPALTIDQRLPQLLEMESGGETAWCTTVRPNPFFSGNPLQEDVARALGVKSMDVQRYIAARGSSLVAWVSEQRLLHCAQQVAETDRKIVEIAISCGYNDLPSFTRAFKRQFGTTPSEYRRVNG